MGIKKARGESIKIKSTAIFCIIGLIFFMVGIYLHEQVHVEIYKSYGIESKVEYFSHFPDFVTIAERPCPTEICESYHWSNEIFTYNIQCFYFLFLFGFAFIIFILENKLGGKK